jgi:hypothetical protein
MLYTPTKECEAIMLKKILLLGFPLYVLSIDGVRGAEAPSPLSSPTKRVRLSHFGSTADMGVYVSPSGSLSEKDDPFHIHEEQQACAKRFIEKYPFLKKLACYKFVVKSSSLEYAIATAWGYGDKVSEEDRKAYLRYILPKLEDYTVETLIQDQQANFGLMPKHELEEFLFFHRSPEEWFSANYILPEYRDLVTNNIGWAIMDGWLRSLGRSSPDLDLHAIKLQNPDFVFLVGRNMSVSPRTLGTAILLAELRGREFRKASSPSPSSGSDSESAGISHSVTPPLGARSSSPRDREMVPMILPNASEQLK